MKGKELIESIISEEVPTAEEIRTHSLYHQPEAKYRPLRMAKVAIALAALFVFTTAAYAVGSYIYRQRFDTGGGWEYVVVPFDIPEYQERLAGPSFVPIYFSPNHEEIRRIAVLPDRNSHDSETAHAIMELLDGLIFTADGHPFDLMLPATEWYPPGRYRPYLGHALFTPDGYEIREIYIRVLFHSDTGMEVLGAAIQTFEGKGIVHGDVCDFSYALARRDETTHTLDEVTEFLGRDLRLPTVHVEMFEPPVFHINRFILEDGTESGYVSVRFRGCEHYSDLLLFLSPVRSEDATPREVLLADGEITVFDEVAGVTVYKVTGFWHATHYIWAHDGFVYTLYPPFVLYGRCPDTSHYELYSSETTYDPDTSVYHIYRVYKWVPPLEPYALTDRQIRELIRSMIE